MPSHNSLTLSSSGDHCTISTDSGLTSNVVVPVLPPDLQPNGDAGSDQGDEPFVDADGNSSLCAWCHKMGDSALRLPTVSGLKSLCSEMCLLSLKRASSRKKSDVCAWCQKIDISKVLTLRTENGCKALCSEMCFAQCRRASFKKNKVCDWCKHVRHTVNYVEFRDGDQSLQFCSDKCLHQYKMNIFCRETQTHLKVLFNSQQQSSSPYPTNDSNRPPNHSNRSAEPIKVVVENKSFRSNLMSRTSDFHKMTTTTNTSSSNSSSSLPTTDPSDLKLIAFNSLLDQSNQQPNSWSYTCSKRLSPPKLSPSVASNDGLQTKSKPDESPVPEFPSKRSSSNFSHGSKTKKTKHSQAKSCSGGKKQRSLRNPTLIYDLICGTQKIPDEKAIDNMNDVKRISKVSDAIPCSPFVSNIRPNPFLQKLNLSPPPDQPGYGDLMIPSGSCLPRYPLLGNPCPSNLQMRLLSVPYPTHHPNLSPQLLESLRLRNFTFHLASSDLPVSYAYSGMYLF